MRVLPNFHRSRGLRRIPGGLDGKGGDCHMGPCMCASRGITLGGLTPPTPLRAGKGKVGGRGKRRRVIACGVMVSKPLRAREF
jgi:hypothetical protein